MPRAVSRVCGDDLFITHADAAGTGMPLPARGAARGRSAMGERFLK